jgi:tRNA dimethylallyltransferase
MGPTAVGKTELALSMAGRFGCEIISVDSMQVYRYMDIGTAKPGRAERAAVVHHLIDIVDPDEQYDAARFVRDSHEALHQILARGRIPLLTGGTGLYLQALTQGLFNWAPLEQHGPVRQHLQERMDREGREGLYHELATIDPASAARIHPHDSQRILRALEIFQTTGRPWSEHLQQKQDPPAVFSRLRQVCLTCDRDLLYARIEERSRLMLASGLVEEVENLRRMGYSAALPSMQSIGYRHVNNYLDGVWTQEEAVRLLRRDTRRYAKRQFTWFTRTPAMLFYEREQPEKVLADTEQWLASGSR